MKLGVLTVALGDMSLDAACKFLSVLLSPACLSDKGT